MNVFLNADFYSQPGFKLESENLQCFLNNSLHKSVPFLDMSQLTKVCPEGDTSRSELKLTKFPLTPRQVVPAVSLCGARKELCTGPASDQQGCESGSGPSAWTHSWAPQSPLLSHCSLP